MNICWFWDAGVYQAPVQAHWLFIEFWMIFHHRTAIEFNEQIFMDRVGRGFMPIRDSQSHGNRITPETQYMDRPLHDWY